MSKTILLVEDEPRMRTLLNDYLKREDFKILEAENGMKALDIFKTNSIDLIILDIMLPLMDGWSVCNTIRKNSNVPIIMLTAKSEEDDKLLGYELGADDYVTKPFSPKILVAKVKALLKRAASANQNEKSIFEADGISINELSHEVSINGKNISLSPKEYELLLYLFKNKNIALTREKILDNVWSYDYDGDFRTVDTHIKRLREKLGEKSQIISTVRGSGYKLEVKDEK